MSIIEEKPKFIIIVAVVLAATLVLSANLAEKIAFVSGKPSVYTAIQSSGFIGSPQTGNAYTISIAGTQYTMTNEVSRSIEWTTYDATAIFNACIGNLTGGGTIHVDNGTYVIKSKICIDENNIHIVGSGQTKLQLDANVTLDIIYSHGTSGISIEKLSIDGNKENNVDTGNRGIQHGIDLSACSNSRIANVQIINCVHTGINLYKGDKNVIENNILVNNGKSTGDSGSGIDSDGCQNSIIANNLAENNYVNGIWIGGSPGKSENMTVMGNIVRNNGGSSSEGHGIHIGTAVGIVTNCLITGNIAENNYGYAGIMVTSTFNTTLENNTSNNNNGRGFSFINSQNLTVSGNTAKNNKDYGGFIFSDGCCYNLIAKNIATGNSNYNIGIIKQSAIGNTISNNYFNTINGIYDNGTNTLIKDNFFNYST